MNPTRREFLERTAMAAAGLYLVPGSLRAASPSPDAVPPGTGMLFDPSDLPRIRRTLEIPRFAEYWKTMTQADMAADRNFLTNELKLNNHAVHILRAWQILQRTSFVYAITGDRKQWELAQVAIDKILQYKRWDYFLEGGEQTIGLQRAPEVTLAMAFAMEWLDDVLPSATKEEMERQIIEKGAPPCFRTLYGMKHPDRVRGWAFDPESDYPYHVDMGRWPIILNSTNLKMIPIAGLGIAGCKFYGKYPQAEQWLDMALQSARAFAPMFGADGSYEEGVSYWGYTAVHLALFLDVLYRKRGLDERHMINFPGTIRYALQMSMPTTGKPGDAVNFGDASVIGDISVASWVAGRFREPIAQYVGMSVGEVKNHLAFIWYDDSVPVKLPGPDLYDVRFANDVVVSRTGWDERSTVVAMRSGGPANHEHADRNSVVVKAFGERLLHDPLKAAYPNTLKHWILRLTESHTAVLINGKGHQYHDGHEGTNASWAWAHVVAYEPSRDHTVVTSDATDAYKLVQPDVDLVTRTLIFLKPDVVIFFDRVRMKTTNATVQLRYQVYNADEKARIETSRTGFDIRRPGGSLKGILDSSTPLTVRSGKIDVPQDIGVYPYVEASAAEGRDHLIYSVMTLQEAGKEHGTAVCARGKDGDDIQIEHNGRKWTVAIHPDKDVPSVHIA